jgi:EAL domain-containing protein (putative c-di-GMP-specific phosphodiesterase class I)/FixJ family two-component response regulator
MVLSQFADIGVLVVDDNAPNVALLRALLRKEGLMRVEVVTDSTLALARFDAMEPGLVLLDLHMPRIDGYTLLEEMNLRSAGRYVPILVLTADTTRDAVHRALKLGARDFVTKPIDTFELTLRVRNLLETRELHEQLRHHNFDLQQELAAIRLGDQATREARDEGYRRIRQALDSDGVEVVFQPIVDLTDDTCVGYEALARFPGEPERTADRWFADAAELGLGQELEFLALRQAVAAFPQLGPDRFMSVNMSPATLLSTELTSVLADTDYGRLVIELTEHVPVEDFDAIERAVGPYRSRGVRLAVDDTGAGYAGFRHILGLHPDVVKLDICLTRGIDIDPARRALAAALVQFSNDTGVQLIAEGVEQLSELTTLRELGIRWAQGFYLAHPGPLQTELVGAAGTVRYVSTQPAVEL